MTTFYLGIDIAKDKFDVCLLQDAQKWSGVFTNNEKGFCKLDEWLAKRVDGKLQTCMEATGRTSPPSRPSCRRCQSVSYQALCPKPNAA